jgi:sterol desaturase/sphingolipid hydroxylase (fatty acid hydroxylase superfamily)
MVINSLFSATLLSGLILGAQPWLVEERSEPWLRSLGSSLLVLTLYDFAYYFLHRYPFHEWRLLKKVHAVHHMAKNPIAIDSLFLHPAENMLGNLLFVACLLAVGPVSVPAFALAFFVYTQLNVWVHSGLRLPWFPLSIPGYLAEKHDKHHVSMRGGNYASLSPLPDLLFGTRE